MRYWVLLLAASVLCMVLASGPDASADWPMFQGTLDHSGFYNGTLPRDNTTMWSYETGLWILSAPAYADGVVYAVGYDYHVHAIDARNGEVIWKTPLDWIIVLSSPAVDLDHNQLYVASLNKLYALNLTTGDIVWEFRNQKNFMETGWPEVGSPAVYNDHVYFGSVDGYLYKIPAIDPNGDGVMTLSEINSDGWYFRSGGVLPDSEGVFYAPVTVAVRPLDTDLVLAATALEGGTNPGKLYAVDDSDGSLVWSYEFGTQTPIINVTAIPGTGSHSGSGPSYDLNAGSNGIVWCPNGDKLYALDLSNGGEIYVKTANDWIMGQSPAWDEHNVYVGDDAGYLTAYDKETGAKAWELYLGGPIRTSPVYDAEGYMYTAWNDLTNRVGVVRCINLTNRITVWELPLEGYVISSFGIGDNVIYVGEADFNDPPFYSAIHSIGHGDLTVDLQVAQVMAKGLREGDAGHIVARIVNDGTTSAFDVKVRFYRGDPDAGGSLIGTAVMPRTRPGTSTPAVLEWAPTASGDLDIYVVVDPDNEIDEELEGNNKGSGTVSVVSGGTSPTSEIVSITPSDVVQDGKTVIHFVGSSDDPDGTVEAHRWTSNIDGFLYSGEEFNLSADQLSMGAHLIRYQVRDDDGLWSDNDTALLIVRPEADDDWLRSGHDVRNTGYSTSPTVPAATIEWSRPIGDSYDAGVRVIASPVVVDGITYYVDFNTTYALNATDGSLIWSYTDSVMYTQAATPAVDPVHGVIAVSGYNLTVLDLDDGSLIWRKTLGLKHVTYEFAGPLIDGDRLYIHSRGDVNITCFNLTTGAEMWNFKVAGGDLYSSPSIGFDRLFVTSYSTDDDNENYYALYALNLTDGTMDWRWRLGDGSIGGVGVPFFGAALSIASPTVFTYQGTDYVVVGDINGKVYAFDPDGEQPRDAIDSDGSGPDPFAGAADDGSPIWERALDEDLIASTSYHDGRIYVITWLGRLYCLDATDGSILWSHDYQMPFWGAPAINNDSLYLAGLDSYVYCIDIDDGTLNWRFLTRPYSFIYSTPALYQGSLFVTGGYGPWLFWLDRVYRIGPFVDTPDLAVTGDLVLMSDDSPEEGDVVQVMIGVLNEGTADADGRLMVFLDEADWSNLLGYGTVHVPAGGASGLSFTWNTSGLYGEHDLIVRVTCPEDPVDVNDEVTVDVFVTKPGQPPFASIDLISPNPVERDPDNTVSFVGSGHASGSIVEYLWNVSGEFLSDEASFSVSADTFEVGTHTITLTVRDDQGMWAEEDTAELRVLAAGGSPEARILEISPNPATTNDTITFRGEGISNRNITGYEWKVNNVFLDDKAEHTKNAGSDIGGPGNYIISFVVIDEDGRRSDPATETLRIVSEESPEITIIDPEDGAEVQGVVNITGTVDSDEKVTEVRVAITEVGGTPDYASSDIVVHGTDDWYASWDTTDLSGGDVEIHARARTESGLTGETYITVTVRSGKPSVAITDPDDGATVGGTVDILGTASDQDGTVERVEVRFDNGAWEEAEITSGEGSSSVTWKYAGWDTTDYPDDTWVTIRARVMDNNSKTATTSISVRVRNQGLPPTVEVLMPANGSVIAYDLHVEGTADDPDTDGYIVRVEISVVKAGDEPRWDAAEEASGTTAWSLDLNVSLYETDDYTLHARAVDNDGMYSAVATVSVRIDNRRPVAVIESASPGMARWGKDTIVLKGRGENGDIVAYEWRSQLDGVLGDSDQVAIPASQLSIGEHTITFRVQAANGIWSAPVETEISVVKEKKDEGGDEGWLPGMEVTVVVIALVAAIALARRRR